MFRRRAEPESQEQRRQEMVREQVASRGVQDIRVLKAMERVPRHEFVPEEYTHRAYEDGPLPIGEEETISQPYIVARMTELLALEGHERVLEIGAGCGYQTAILSQLVAQVCSVELNPDLADCTRRRLQKMGIENMELRVGSGFDPWPGGGSFDAILCACAPAEPPEILLKQLKLRGRLVLPIGEAGQLQELQQWTRISSEDFKKEEMGAVRFVPMIDPDNLS